MGQIIPRSIFPLLESSLQESRITAILGARQVGKSTLARSLPNPYYSLDDLGTRSFAARDPVGFAQSLPAGAIIDEIQRVPDLLLAIKSIVDLEHSTGRFVVTGSANILTLPKLADTLAGRMRILELHPLAEAEIEKGTPVGQNFVDRLFDEHFICSELQHSSTDLIARVVRGGYPEILRRSVGASRDDWFADYIIAILQREVREISRIGEIGEIERVLRLLAVRTGQMLSPTSLSSDIGIPKETLRRYFRILEQLYLVHALPAWSPDAGRQYIKSPKFHINDTGLAAYELGANEQLLTKNHNLLGNLLETFVVNEIRKQASWSVIRPRLYHLRIYDGREIDLILQARDGRSVAIEIKATASQSARDARTLCEVANNPKSPMLRGVFLSTGERSVPIGERVLALPIEALWRS
jgi:predicted AAA+ superfamily ATPase